MPGSRRANAVAALLLVALLSACTAATPATVAPPALTSTSMRPAVVVVPSTVAPAQLPTSTLAAPATAVVRNTALPAVTATTAQASLATSVAATAAATAAAAKVTTVPADVALALVKYDAANYRCNNLPPLTRTDKTWQVSAPRQPAKAGSSIEVGLRNKWGEANETYNVTAVVVAPDGSTARGAGTLKSTDWAYVYYPAGFPGAKPAAVGNYTVVWLIGEGVVACDGFSVVA